MSIALKPGGAFPALAGAPGFKPMPAYAPPISPAVPPAPDPRAVQRQKELYARSLEDQLKDGAATLEATMRQQVEGLRTQAAQERTLHSLQVDQQVKQKELILSQQYNQQLMLLTQAAQRQGAELEQQATSLMLEYQQKKVEEDFLASQAGVEKQYQEVQKRFSRDLAAQQTAAMTAGGHAATTAPGIVPLAPMGMLRGGPGPALAPQKPSFGQGTSRAGALAMAMGRAQPGGGFASPMCFQRPTAMTPAPYGTAAAVAPPFGGAMPTRPTSRVSFNAFSAIPRPM